MEHFLLRRERGSSAVLGTEDMSRRLAKLVANTDELRLEPASLRVREVLRDREALEVAQGVLDPVEP
jgi:hypothetical protein